MAVQRFVAAVEDSVTGDSLLGVEGGSKICAFHFASLRRDGLLSLIAESCDPDRPNSAAVEVIDKTQSGFELYEVPGNPGVGGDISKSIKDLGHDSRQEFVLDSGGAEFPQQCRANWTAIYAWTGASYTNVSVQFKDLYRERLALLNKIIPSLPPVPGPDGYDVRAKECLEAEAAAIQRFLGGPPDAGIQQAIRMATSNDPLAQQFGATLLTQIGTPEARKYLEKMTADSDYGTAQYAKDGLAQTAKGPPNFVAASFNLAGSARF